ncbi:MAG: bifunctional molybdenum cofactor biosynthesis protein MoaC/MoaB [Crocinitomicaceae bacterium]|nr:bifunctional molybdenum cofactor biosynthesis protein MoaC/MoaB [Crocinitomicaceae bacterium]|tara:strand:+ start:7488 stop:8399 length:912 start_codon:yes stop_codon:yes gene_type:complete
MVEITHKSTSLRRAVAQATVLVSKQETIDAIVNNTVPKGNVFEMAKTAGLFAVKKTSDVIPDCHPLPVEFTGVSYKIDGLKVFIDVEVKTIYRTGVEVEAMHGASIVALTMYDMLKPIDKGIEVQNIKLLEKQGGKSDFRDKFRKDLTAAVIVCSDTIAAGTKEDRAGKSIIAKLEASSVEIIEYTVVPDEIEDIQRPLLKHAELGTDMIIYTGGTGLSVRDVTPEALLPLIDREIPGIAEASRNYGQDRTPFSMLSRSVAGVKDKTLVLALPGSTKGASESMDALFPALLHIFRIFKGARHD